MKPNGHDTGGATPGELWTGLNREGEAAGNAGKPFEANPYDLGTLESIAWIEGWAKRRP